MPNYRYSDLTRSYKGNPDRIFGKPNYGRKVQDDYGNWTYTDLLSVDDFGNTYDPKFSDGDRDGKK